MWENKIGSATLAGHGYGGKVALATGCFNPERSSGVFVIDSSPMDHRYHEAFREVKGYVEKLHSLNLGHGRGEAERFLKEHVLVSLPPDILVPKMAIIVPTKPCQSRRTRRSARVEIRSRLHSLQHAVQ
jgi:pimeloyl-ACP methyl ester carboxylesterase